MMNGLEPQQSPSQLPQSHYSRLIQKVLESAGVSVLPFIHNNAELITYFGDWLDPESSLTTCLQDSSAKALDASFYQALGALLSHGWKEAVRSVVVRNTLRENGVTTPTSNQHSGGVSLADTVQAVQVTQWLRTAMELYVMDDDDEGKSESMCFKKLFLLHNQGGIDLLQALLEHVSNLAYLQQQIYYQTQAPSIRQTSPHHSTASSPTLNVQSRLQQYQQAQEERTALLQQLELHLDNVEYIWGEWYWRGSVDFRKASRTGLGLFWQDFIHQASQPTGGKYRENTSAVAVPLTLRLLRRILQGHESATTADTPLPSYQHLLLSQLLPLHQPSGVVLWRDQTALLGLYHEPLVQCVALLLQYHTPFLERTLLQLVQSTIWPAGGAHTPKTVLLLHEVDTLLLAWKDAETYPTLDSTTLQAVLVRLSACWSSDNSRTAEGALQLFRNSVYCHYVLDQHYMVTVPLIVASLVPKSSQRELPWNPTVRKMTYHVLRQVQQADPEKFAHVCQSAFGRVRNETTSTKSTDATTTSSLDETRSLPSNNKSSLVAVKESDNCAETVSSATARLNPPTHDFSLKHDMGSWRPPPKNASSARRQRNPMLPPPARPPQSSSKPPLTVTGVAPWAAQPQKQSKYTPPPLTITGVAPWAQQSAATTTPASRQKRSAPQPLLEEEDDDEAKEPIECQNVGLSHVLSYMERLKPPEEDHDGTSSWAKAQMAESPTLLPTLKFHDLVFGHELGSGAFGSVKYARLIDKGTTRSHWSEYAVKIVRTQKIIEMGYEASIHREICILRVLSHPCIARLISSFRFRDGAYLVLEYASKGDLHSSLRQHGSLDEESTRFVVGEIVAALSSIHDLGFVYGDLKPENILITETGHIKLTDFGGCRPVTNEAKELIRASGKNILSQLRDGDWKPQEPAKPKEDDWVDEDGEEEDDDAMSFTVETEALLEEDIRVEGTTAYLPPEVVMGAIPTIAADSWALGCVLYQCLSGRPPLLDQDDDKTRHKIVTFQEPHPSSSDTDELFSEKHASDISKDARLLIRQLLAREASARPTMTQTASATFFKGVDCFALHHQEAPSLDMGSVAPVAEDSQWARRQFSSIWAPQPKSYDLTTVGSPQSLSGTASRSKAPIPEGDEANCFFTASRQPSMISSERSSMSLSE